ncbi:hypothetical protein [Paraburkholderia aspalathi]|jgi:hypothetical protein|uniref:hypothetical protein n=1 Tax=Paraburkholderia aspalathi TaxID=1324617 RepID=UPI000EF99BD5|nr:hypothetical protein [Paraburkholderia aspalathi]CAE6843085.1 hypothetical protein R20943_07210 [Paraburkholderia aspalathi]
MFHTVAYKGHYIHLSYVNNVEHVQTQIITPESGFDLKPRRTLVGAKRAITRHVQASSNPAFTS